MEEWLIRELEYKKEMDASYKRNKESLNIAKRSDLMCEFPAQIKHIWISHCKDPFDFEMYQLISKYESLESISFSSFYEADINFELLNKLIRILPNLTDLMIWCRSNSSVTWSNISILNLEKIRSFKLMIRENGTPIKLKSEAMEELVIHGFQEEKLTPLERWAVNRTPFDLSGVSNLRKVELWHMGFLDYNSLACLVNLKHLVIKDVNLVDMNWISDQYQLEYLYIQGDIEQLDGIEKQPLITNLLLPNSSIYDISHLVYLKKLRVLDLRENQIEDISPILNLEKLEYLNLFMNPVSNEESIGKRNISNVIIRHEDKDYIDIDSKISDFSRTAYLRVKLEKECDLEKVPNFSKRIIIENRNKPYEIRLKEEIQRAFEATFCEINPFAFRGYSLEHKKEYVRRAELKYPFLNVTAKMENIAQIEKECRISNVGLIPGLTFFADADLVRIYVKATSGNGKLTQEYDIRYQSHTHLSNEHLIKSLLLKTWENYFPGIKLSNYNLRIIYVPLYGKEVNEKILLALMCAIYSAINNLPMEKKYVLTVKLNIKGRIVQDNVSTRHINAVRCQNFTELIGWDKTSYECRKEGDMSVYGCSDVTDLLKILFGDNKAYESLDY